MTQLKTRIHKRVHKAPERSSFSSFLKLPSLFRRLWNGEPRLRVVPAGTLFRLEEAHMLKKLMISTALSAVMVTAAFAQSPNTPASPSTSPSPPPAAQSQDSGKNNFVTAQKPDQW